MIINVKIPRDLDWTPQDKLQLMLGTENVATLAASTPGGGTLAPGAEVPAWESWEDHGGFGVEGFGEDAFGLEGGGWGFGEGPFGVNEFGINEAPQVEIVHRYSPADKCGVLPIGVRAVDPLGNVSAVMESLVAIADTPRGARGLAIAATANPLEARITWTESPDV